MLTNKELKQSGRQTVRKHYLLLLMLCAIAVMFGNEFSNNDGILRTNQLIHQIHQSREADDQAKAGAPTDSDAPIPGPAAADESPAAADSPASTSPSPHSTHQEVRNRLEEAGAARMGISDKPAADVIRDLLRGDLAGGWELSQLLEEQFEASGTDAVGHTEGVLAYVINTVSSGTLAVQVFVALDNITGSEETATIIFALIGLALYIFFGVGVPEIYAVVLRRNFLEARVYDTVPLHHGFHLLKVRRCVRATLCIVLKDLLYILWCLTIAGAFIKRYSYFLVPYIVAENPDIRPLEAITLSRKMMDGHKMEAFKFELSFLHWILLGVATLGLSNVFWYLPFKIASTTEYYACVRRMAKEAGIEGVQRLDDEALLARADQPLLEKMYADVQEEKQYLEANRIVLTGRRKFFAEWLAIWFGSSEEKAQYQQIENRSYRLTESMQALAGEVYPVRLDPRVNETNRRVSHQISFLRCYTIWNLLFMFILFCFIGWIWEVIVFMLQTGQFVNRGSLYGPWIPIYGVGGAMIIVVLSKLRTKPLAAFFAIVVLCGTIEFFTSWAMEKIHGMRWWDYSGYFLNLDGRICAEGLIAFGVLGMMAIYMLAPALDTLLMKVSPKIMMPLSLTLMGLFFCDVVYAQIHPHVGKGITDMGSQLLTAQRLEVTEMEAPGLEMLGPEAPESGMIDGRAGPMV